VLTTIESNFRHLQLIRKIRIPFDKVHISKKMERNITL
jgi:hypothetical protein